MNNKTLSDERLADFVKLINDKIYEEGREEEFNDLTVEEGASFKEMYRISPNFTEAFMELFKHIGIDNMEAALASPASCRDQFIEFNLMTEEVEREIFAMIFAGGDY